MEEQSNFETVEFLVKTLSSIQVSLNTIEKDSSRKAESMKDITEQIVMIVDAFKRSNDAHSHINESNNEKIDSINKNIEDLKTKLTIIETRKEIVSENFSNLTNIINAINMKTETLTDIEKKISDARDVLLELKVTKALKDNQSNFSWFNKMISFFTGIDTVYKILLVIAFFIALISTIAFKVNVLDLIKAFL